MSTTITTRKRRVPSNLTQLRYLLPTKRRKRKGIIGLTRVPKEL